MSYISSNAPSSPSKFCRVNGSAATLARTKVDARAELRTMAHRKVYVSDVEPFFDNFFPPNTSTSKKAIPNIFKGAPTTFSSEKAMYKWLCERLNSSGQFNGKVFVNTGYKPDPNDDTRQAIDCGMYLSESAPAIGFTALGEESRRNIWSALELGMECKVQDSADPLEEQPEADTDEPTTEGGKSVWAQLLSYAALVFKFQKRLFHYIVIFFGKHARILRFDHSGIVATEKINYTTEEGGAHLTQFFVRYCRFQAKNRGHDPTATRINGKDTKVKDKEEGLAELAEEMRKYGQEVAELLPKDHVPSLFNKTLDEQWPWWRLEVYDETTDSYRHFAVGKPHFYSGGVVGRGTCGYIAVPLDEKNRPMPLCIGKDGKPVPLAEASKFAPSGADKKSDFRDVYFVYLKDAWRVDHPGIEKEGAVLHVLNQHKVPFVPTLLYHGDLVGQDTLSYARWPAYHDEEDPIDCPLKAHQHYRLVVAEVGKPLSEFTNGRELVTAILCCVVAHKEACKAGYIHRDISAGNILLYPTASGVWMGMLNDWELSKTFTDGQTDEGNRQFDRTGTWQFTSVHALNDYSKIITIPDDLESLFHVMLYFAIRFLPHNGTDIAPELLVAYFDDYMRGREANTASATKFNAMHAGKINITPLSHGKKTADGPKRVDEHLTFLWPSAKPTDKLHPTELLFRELFGWFKALYAQDDPEKDDGAGSKDAVEDDEVLGDQELLESLQGTGDGDDAALLSAPQTNVEAEKLALRELAQKLESHDAMEALLRQCVKRSGWPARDKGLDKRPKGGYTPPKDNIPATSTQIGSKRAVENGAEPGSKRVRSKARA